MTDDRGMFPELAPEIAARVAAIRDGARLRTVGEARARLDLDEVSPAEHRVLVLLCEGLPNEEIAARIFIGHETVKSHVRQLLARCRCRNRAQLAYRWGHGELAVIRIVGPTKVTLIPKTYADP